MTGRAPGSPDTQLATSLPLPHFSLQRTETGCVPWTRSLSCHGPLLLLLEKEGLRLTSKSNGPRDSSRIL